MQAKQTPTIYGFAPIENKTAQILILGSMPGRASLTAHEYYRHPHNAFWKIMGELIGAHANLPYQVRLDQLRLSNIALWDVLASCIRPTSLDSHIEPDSIIANDFDWFFSNHPNINTICFNGAKAEQCFKKYVLPDIGDVYCAKAIQYIRLPSTSPAHAGMPYAAKLKAWRAALLPANTAHNN